MLIKYNYENLDISAFDNSLMLVSEIESHQNKFNNSKGKQAYAGRKRAPGTFEKVSNFLVEVFRSD